MTHQIFPDRYFCPHLFAFSLRLCAFALNLCSFVQSVSDLSLSSEVLLTEEDASGGGS
jgi:hypothetical protein